MDLSEDQPTAPPAGESLHLHCVTGARCRMACNPSNRECEGFSESAYVKVKRELAEAKAQLPDGMKDCTIVFKECAKGHGELTATNWVQHDCVICRAETVEAEAAALKRDAERYRWLRGRCINGFSVTANNDEMLAIFGAFSDDNFDAAIDRARTEGGSK